MKIAFFTDDYLPYVHGVTTSIQNYRHALESLGHEVYIVAPRSKQKDFVETDDHVIRLPSVNSYVFDKRPVSLLYPGIARKLYKYNFDIIHSQTQFYLFVIAGMVAKKQNLPHITTVHTIYTELLDDYPAAVTAGLIAVSIGFPFVFKTKPILPFSSASEIRNLSKREAWDVRKSYGWRLTAASINQADIAIAPSEHLKDSLLEYGASVPIHLLPNGIPLARYQNAHIASSVLDKKRGEKFIISVARVSGEKRQEALIDAMTMIKTKNVKMIIVGDGPKMEEWQQKTNDLGLSQSVIFTGMQSAECVAGMLKQSDIFTLASYRFDNQPMSILEAIASGLPVVYCDDNLKEGLGLNNSLLTRDETAQSFAAAFDEILSDDTKLRKMQEASKLMSKSFDNVRLTKKLLTLYEQAISNQ